ncbi:MULTISPECIES: endonuclease/exonuclease/phosphatase family protein [Gilliamella]|uniref:endonuclease/exonuclease/phosphatase family protein n=1 Tax=Gilliamella TaxID=1193503 RepID=UPI000AF4978D|nr:MULTISPECIES: endonuclease/exonuclease/phosphatase family protein [Gilliamella]MBI0005290.1 endonuclease/exonuclease/phosphatase family protein [Gilliamella sp. W8126]MBI0037614.1 endonuclease/exonuclease/phosphatase family protein [Gilliamella sp. B14384G10]MBI0039609.1 endonuclease/exonuclease/phosphatase family protein [Gilliamella sp. B14384G7]MBI0051449.1 endonuclease/exonuclease/phosphatase family protein [Gilliamella sp. B14384G13]MBI0053901.1 endonuclease/exonuclease/phosphatase fam
MNKTKLKIVALISGIILSTSSAFASLDDAKQLKIISYNVYNGMKLDESEGKQKYIDWAKAQDADIIAWQEMNFFTREKLEKFAASYGHKYAVLLKESPEDAAFFPVAITSKYPIINVNKVVDNLWHGALYADIGNYHFVITHMNPFWTAKRIDEINLIIDSIKYSRDPKGKWIIAGDLNSFSPADKSDYDKSTLLEDIKEKQKKRPILENLVDGKLSYTVQQNLLDAGFIDALKIKHKEFVATAPTKVFYDQASVPLRYDYIYVSPPLKNNVIDVEVIKDDFTDKYSDHYPVQMIIKNN